MKIEYFCRGLVIFLDKDIIDFVFKKFLASKVYKEVLGRRDFAVQDETG